MQKRFLSLSAAVLAAAVLFSSCSKTNKQGRFIPSTAGIVIHINGESINSKLPWDEFKQNEMVKKMSADTSLTAFEKSVLDNPENAGIDIKNDIEIFMVKDSAGGYMGIEGALKDEAKFKQFLANGPKEGVETSKDGYTYFSNKKGSVGYNKDRFIVAVNVPKLGMMDKMPAMAEDTGFAAFDEMIYNRDMSTVTTDLINLKEDASLAKNNHFSDLMSEKGDIHFYYSPEYFNMMAGKLGKMAAVVDMKKLTEGSAFTAAINFDDGKVNFDAKSYASKALSDIYKKYSGGSFDQQMIKNIPSKDLAGMFILNFKPEAIGEALKAMNLDGFANLGLTQAGLTMDDLTKAMKGDMMISITDIKSKSDTTAGQKAQVIFATSVGDKNEFNKLLDAGKKMVPMMAAANTGQTGWSMNDKYFVVSNNKSAADAFLAGTANNSFPFVDQISGGPMGGYINFQYIFSAMKPAATDDSLDLAEYDATVKMFDNAMISGGNYKDGGITQHWELNLMDKKTNSLKQFNNYAASIALIEQKKSAKRAEMWKVDMNTDTSTVVGPVIQAPVVFDSSAN